MDLRDIPSGDDGARVKIGESSSVTFGVLFVMAGGIAWLAATNSRSETRIDNHDKELAEIKALQHEYNETVKSIDKRLSNMETEVQLMRKSL